MQTGLASSSSHSVEAGARQFVKKASLQVQRSLGSGGLSATGMSSCALACA